jgi:cysteine desulfurase / selenocysteine lyase
MKRPMIYLDHAATSWPKPDQVGLEVARSLSNPLANAGRSGHQPSVNSARMVFNLREKLAETLGVNQSRNLIFTSGCTEGLNLILKGFLKTGARVAVSPMEHNAVMRPLSGLQQSRQISVSTLPADRWGHIDLGASNELLRQQDFDLVVIAQASNVNGVVQDLAGIREAIGKTPLLVDAAQTAGVLPIDIQGCQVDFLCCSMHKGLLGPTGLGVCYISPDHELKPLIEGGTGSDSESEQQPSFRPDCYESGTMNLHGIAGSLGALAGLPQRGLLGEHKQKLSQQLCAGLEDLPGIHLCNPGDGKALCVSLTLEKIPPDRMALQLEQQYGILSRPGLQCAPAAHGHLGTRPQGTLRLSPGWGNTEADIDTAIEAIRDLLPTLNSRANRRN